MKIQIFLLLLVLMWGSAYPQASLAMTSSLAEITAKAEQGDAVAEYELGWMYQGGGKGLSQDCEVAVKWYRKSAEQGYEPPPIM